MRNFFVSGLFVCCGVFLIIRTNLIPESAPQQGALLVLELGGSPDIVNDNGFLIAEWEL